MALLTNFFRFFIDFERILGGFRKGLGMNFDDFSHFFQNNDFTEKSTKHCVGAWILKVGSYKNMWNSGKNWTNIKKVIELQITSQKFTQKSDLEGLGPHLGGGWDGLGPLWAALGWLLFVFWTFKIQLFSSMAPRWAPKGLLGRVWEGLGRIWGRFG